MWDNSNIQEGIEWGNVELPGLTDEELYKKNWNLITANREVIKNRDKDGSWSRKNAEAAKNRRPGWSNTISETSFKTKSNPEWKKTFKKTIEKRNQDPEYFKKLHEGIDKRNNDSEWYKKNLEAAQKRIKAIMTPEGKFNSVKEAIEHYNKVRNSLYSESWLMTQRKKHPTKFYLIDN
jgi:DNA repair ATPase RecN